MRKTDDNYIEIEEHGKLVLPSEMDAKRRQIKKDRINAQKNLKTFKWITIIALLILAYIYYDNIVHYFLNLLKLNPTIYKYYLLIESEIKNNTLRGLFFVSIMGALFFLVLPSEALFIYYLSSTTINPGTVLILTLLGAATGLSFNYFFGRLLGEKVLKFIFRKNFEKYKMKIMKYGGYVLFFGNIFPGPIEVLAVFYGGFKFGYLRFIYIAFIGRFIKYLLLLIMFFFFWDQITHYYSGLVDSFLIIKSLYIK